MNQPTQPIDGTQTDADSDAHSDDAKQQHADRDDTSGPIGAHPTGERQAAENAKNELPG